MNSQSYDESFKHKNEQVPTSSKNQVTKSEQKSLEEEHYLSGRSLCVSPLPKTLLPMDLVNFFRRFGTIKRQHFGQDFFWIEYTER